ncbi:MAG: DNA-processing protein DprA [Porphyromonas sp.]|nr:DNA-processing protein DprA [Porphyromonas sp.]
MEWSQEQKALLALSCTEGIGPIISQSLIEHFGSAQSVIEATPSALMEVPGMGPKLVSALRSPVAQHLAESEISLLNQRTDAITPVFFGHQDYPELLGSCFDAPLVLYVRGVLPHDAPMISVVGTRRMTPYAEDALRSIFSEWAHLSPNIVIVSGLAYGVDHAAHRIALDCGLRTVAVVAHGHHTLYPAAHKSLAKEICERGGGVITEYMFDTKPLPQRFVARNRIVAGLSTATLLVESPDHGGSLITANIAFDYSRALYAVPGRMFDSNSSGCNKMISMQKAGIFTSAYSMLEDLGIVSKPEKQQIQLPLEYEEDISKDIPIVRLLKSVDDISVEDITHRLGESLATVSALLFDLELDGLVRPLPGGRYSWINK